MENPIVSDIFSVKIQIKGTGWSLYRMNIFGVKIVFYSLCLMTSHVIVDKIELFSNSTSGKSSMLYQNIFNVPRPDLDLGQPHGEQLDS